MDNKQFQYLLTQPEWQKKWKAILERDGHQCKNCDSNEHLEVHHRQYHVETSTGNKTAPWDYDNQYLITLCHHCHQLGHKHYKIPSFNL